MKKRKKGQMVEVWEYMEFTGTKGPMDTKGQSLAFTQSATREGDHDVSQASSSRLLKSRCARGMKRETTGTLQAW